MTTPAMPESAQPGGHEERLGLGRVAGAQRNDPVGHQRHQQHHHHGVRMIIRPAIAELLPSPMM